MVERSARRALGAAERRLAEESARVVTRTYIRVIVIEVVVLVALYDFSRAFG